MKNVYTAEDCKKQYLMKWSIHRSSRSDVLQNRCSSEFLKFQWKTPLWESYFSNVAGLKTWNFVKKRLQHSCFPVKFVIFLRTPPMAAYEFCSGGCVRIVSAGNIIISNQCIKVNVWSVHDVAFISR